MISVIQPTRFQAAGGFNPSELTDVQNWWDVYNLSASDGATVSLVPDNTAGQNFTSALGPAWVAAERALQFDRTNNEYLTGNLISSPLTDTYSIIMILRLDDVPTNTDAIWSNEVTYGAGDISLRGRGGGQYATRMYFDGSSSGGSITSGLSTWVMHTTVLRPGGWSAYINTTLSQSGGDASIPINILLIGEDTGATTGVTPPMTVGDIITVQSDITANGTDFTDLFNYYQPLYGL